MPPFGVLGQGEEKIKPAVWLWGLSGLLVLLCGWALGCGYLSISFWEIPKLLVKGWPRWEGGDFSENELKTFVLVHLRGVRVVGAVVVGAGLGVSGVLTQTIFRNPLADPGLVGISSGVAMGTLAVLFVAHGRVTSQPLLGFGVGVGMVTLVYRISRRFLADKSLAVLLAGIALNALSAAVIGLILSFGNNELLRDFSFWSLGSFVYLSWTNVFWLILFVGLPSIVACFLGKPLNILSLGEVEARVLGWNPDRLQRWVLFLLAAIVGGSVAACGTIGFVGLIVPHILRPVLGPDRRQLLWGSAIGGAILLVASDLMSRTFCPDTELPIGIFTALWGGPTLLFILWSTAKNKRN
ncbi:MAG: iron ABC transporter permease [Puniceicoccales bacterium]|jgi:iron complex transport system permease protein|nr:iron ABC transporter permease [Puniceicoccales bacterium]